MRLEVDPAVSEDELAVIRRALARSDLRLEDATPDVFSSAWWRTAVREAVDRDSESAADYALSPRSTRGATRA